MYVCYTTIYNSGHNSYEEPAYCLPAQRWTYVLELALQYGWEPHGTLPTSRTLIHPAYAAAFKQYDIELQVWADRQARYEEVYGDTDEADLSPERPPEPIDGWIQVEHIEDWHGRYDTRDFQRVTAEDAANLAAALERAVPDLVDRVNAPVVINVQTGDAMRLHRRVHDSEYIDAVTLFDDPDKINEVEAVIKVCRAGEFVICPT